MLGIFAGLIPAGPAYTATKQDVVLFFSGGVLPANPAYVSTNTVPAGDNINAAIPGPYYSASMVAPQVAAFGQQPVSAPPYLSTTVSSRVVGVAGLSTTDNPGRLLATGGDPAVPGYFPIEVSQSLVSSSLPSSSPPPSSGARMNFADPRNSYLLPFV